MEPIVLLIVYLSLTKFDMIYCIFQRPTLTVTTASPQTLGRQQQIRRTIIHEGGEIQIDMERFKKRK